MIKRKDHPTYKLLQERSDFFCTAKWNELFLYLNHGLCNSCHHPIPHEIPKELLGDPNVLHNTPHKLAQQQLMIDGKRPKECHMCWHIEDRRLDQGQCRQLAGPGCKHLHEKLIIGSSWAVATLSILHRHFGACFFDFLEFSLYN